MKILIFLINAIYWLGIFIIPAGIMCFVSLWIYYKYENGLLVPGLVSITGIISGILLAEYVRTHYGLNSFWSRLSSTPDIDNNEDQNPNQ